ncbi:hypothetical protein CFP56_006113 [Quercus suber]|uniref:Uncharacterized protein n=1 Tax=Quercus suber TaxID=58331 RepID=A0AAW0IFK0_QUESU
MDIDCALLATTTINEEQIHNFLHGHPLILGKNKQLVDDEEEVNNFCVCGKGCSTGPTYSFLRILLRTFVSWPINIYFHKSCIELPQQIFHPFHPYHPLTQLKRSDIRESYSYFDKLVMNNESFCNACRKLILPFTCGQQNSQSIAYICEDYKCDFLLDAECSTLMLPAITYEVFADTIVVNHIPSLVSIVILISILPVVHYHILLKLNVIYIPSSLQILHFKRKRERKTRHTNCTVMLVRKKETTVISSLKGEYGDVELRSTLGHYDDIEQLNSILRAQERKQVIDEEDDHDEEDSVHEAFLLSGKAYTRFVKILDCGVKIPEPFNSVQEIIEVSSKWTPKEKVASVVDYMVPLRLAPILKQLLSKHGGYILHDKHHGCGYNKDLLLNWWTSLRILPFTKFKIQFVFNHLKRLAHAYYGLHVKKKADNALDELDKIFKHLKVNTSV